MNLDETELFILKVIGDNGGTIPRDFFASKMNSLVDKGAVEAAFEHKEKWSNNNHFYRLTAGGKGAGTNG